MLPHSLRIKNTSHLKKTKANYSTPKLEHTKEIIGVIFFSNHCADLFAQRLPLLGVVSKTVCPTVRLRFFEPLPELGLWVSKTDLTEYSAKEMEVLDWLQPFHCLWRRTTRERASTLIRSPALKDFSFSSQPISVSSSFTQRSPQSTWGRVKSKDSWWALKMM
jgi:hypothetical protein